MYEFFFPPTKKQGVTPHIYRQHKLFAGKSLARVIRCYHVTTYNLSPANGIQIGGGWIDVLHFVQSCTHAGTVSNHIGTVNAAQWHATDPSKATRSLRNVFCLAECSPWHTLVLGPESFFVKAALSRSRQRSHAARNRWRNTEEFACFLLSSCHTDILKVVFHLNGRLPIVGIETVQKPQQAAGCVRAGLWNVCLQLPHSKTKVEYPERLSPHPHPGCSRLPERLGKVAFTENNFLFYP